jgi:hypothetical protein
MDELAIVIMTTQICDRLRPIVLHPWLPPIPESDEAVIQALCGALAAVYAKVHSLPPEANEALRNACRDALQACRDHLREGN